MISSRVTHCQQPGSSIGAAGVGIARVELSLSLASRRKERLRRMNWTGNYKSGRRIMVRVELRGIHRLTTKGRT
jgi:hypothetical protein